MLVIVFRVEVEAGGHRTIRVVSSAAHAQTRVTIAVRGHRKAVQPENKESEM
jgi:hypothetical protein